MEDFNKIKHFDDAFFEVTADFVLVKYKFFRKAHSIQPYTLWIAGSTVRVEPRETISYQRVLFILDTPRHHQFDYANDFAAGMPLSAKSYENFKNTFATLMQAIDGMPRGTGYEVTFYTTVPYQTSLHYLLGKAGNEMTRFNFWYHGWNVLKYNKSFVEFVKSKPFDYYINCSNRIFKNIISNTLSLHIREEYQVNHPSNRLWNQKAFSVPIKKLVHLNGKDIFD